MLAAALTTILFSLSVVFGARSAKLLGPQLANLCRLSFATVLLAIWAHVFGCGIGGPGLPWFLFSGVIGFGLGDICLFGALPRIGPRLSILLTQCLAAPIAAVTEWLWLGTTLHPSDIACAVVILAGVAIALAPDHGVEIERRTFWIGALFGIGSAFGQGMGAVISRKAIAVGAAAGFSIDGGTAAYQRAIGGVILTWLAAIFFRSRSEKENSTPPQWRKGWFFMVANALAGPSVGVGCFQWALKSKGSGIVLPIVATSPLVTILLSWLLDRTQPTRRAVIGGLIAVGGAIALSLFQSAK
jgi:drug/metabolite transporter (DMT)-like permease